MENNEKIRELAEKLKKAADTCAEIMKCHGIENERILSIGLSADGYMSVYIENENWSIIRCAGEEYAKLRIEEELPL